MNKNLYIMVLLLTVFLACVFFSSDLSSQVEPEIAKAVLYKKIEIPESLLAGGVFKEKKIKYGGDIRVGDLTGNGEVDFLVFRSSGDGTKPCFIAAFDIEGRILWQAGSGGEQPIRPGPVAVFDIDNDGNCEVINFFVDEKKQAAMNSMANVAIQIRDGKTGKVKLEKQPEIFKSISGAGANWVHHRILVANLTGGEHRSDFICKLGNKLLAFNNKIELLFCYDIKWNEYGKCSAYIPSVGDIDGDGKDEINGGYYLLDDDGGVMWEKQLGDNMDSVAITKWDNDKMRAICSGFGHVLDEKGNVILKLGKDIVPHGQEVRVARFKEGDPDRQMLIRYNGHNEDVMVVDVKGEIINKFKLNQSPNNTGMEVVYWNGPDGRAMLYNGGELWNPIRVTSVSLPGLSKPVGPARMGWYHCIAGNVCSDDREEIVLYNPWDRFIWIYSPEPLNAGEFKKYIPMQRQYNCRIMD